MPTLTPCPFFSPFPPKPAARIRSAVPLLAAFFSGKPRVRSAMRRAELLSTCTSGREWGPVAGGGSAGSAFQGAKSSIVHTDCHALFTATMENRFLVTVVL